MKDEAQKKEVELLSLDGHEVRITSPQKPYFTRQAKLTKLDIVRYYLAVAPGALNGIRNRPIVLKRFVNGAEQEPFYQKRAPSDTPSWLRTVTLSFPSGRTAEEVVVDDVAGLAWIVNLGCMELHPHAVTASDLEHPNELRIDLDPGPGVAWEDVRRVAVEVNAVLGEVGLRGWPKTSGSRGIHVNVRIEPRWSFTEVRRAALALAREVERRVPTLATSKWWKEERHGVFLDYNQNAKDRTTSSAYSVRPLADARVSAPLTWDEVPLCDAAEFTVFTMPERFARIGDPHAEMDLHAGSLEALLDLAARDEAAGLGDAPWPPHFRKMEGEPARVMPSKARTAGSRSAAARKPAAAKAAPKPEESADSGLSAETDSPEGVSADGVSAEAAPKKRAAKKSAGRASKMPLLTIAHSTSEQAALDGLERWKAKYPEAAAHLAVDDVLIDRMRGSSTIWFRIRVNLRHVPEDQRPAQETPDPDDDPTRAWREQWKDEEKKQNEDSEIRD